MMDFDEIAGNLEHFAAIVNTQAHRGYAVRDAETLAKLAEAVKLLDEVSEELCEAQEADEERQDTEDYLNNMLDADSFKAAFQSLTIFKR